MTIAALVPNDAQAPDPTARSRRTAVHHGSSVPCVYCREPIPASTFTFWSSARRLLSAVCPDCHRRVTLATSTWRRWLKQPIA